MAATDDQSNTRSQLIDGQGRVICPQCEIPRSLHWYKRLQQIEAYAMETNPILQCPHYKPTGCGHIFSPGDHSLLLSVLAPPQPNGSREVEVIADGG